MTSVKEFRIEREPTDDELGLGAFYFTDAYSVFDWGEMPDPIPAKGRSLCAMGAFNFERLEAEGIPTHYRGVVPESDAGGQSPASPVTLDVCETAPREMAIDLTVVPDLPHDGRTYDYDAYYDAVDTHYLVPLEIVFRNTVPVGSSLRRRTDPADHGLAFDSWPDEPIDLSDPIVEFSTKYEESDRYLDREEADRIAGAATIEDLEAVAREVNRVITDRAAETGFVHQDGKIECLYADGEIRVADVVGTFDENRFAYDGQQVSKEVIRQYHKRTQPDWVAAVDEAKARAKREDVADWRPLCELQPDPLPERVIQAARDLYCAGANRYVGRALLDAPSMDDAVATVRDL